MTPGAGVEPLVARPALPRGEKPPPAKEPSIQSLRAVAALLIVAFHIRNDAPLAPVADWYEWLAYSAREIRVPLFTVISGYLYASRPAVLSGFVGFATGKMRRLLLPMCTVATLEYLMRVLYHRAGAPDDLAGIWRIYVLPYGHYWFLQAIFLVFLAVGALDGAGGLRSPRTWLLALLAAVLLALAQPLPRDYPIPFSAAGALTLLPFFLLGLGMQRFPGLVFARVTVRMALGLFVATLALFQLNWLVGQTLIDSRPHNAVGLLLGASAIVLLVRYRPQHPVLAWLGGFSFSIYLFQAIGAGVGRRVLAWPGINPHLYFVTLLLLVAATGVAAELLARRIPVLRLLLLGLTGRAQALRPTQKGS